MHVQISSSSFSALGLPSSCSVSDRNLDGEHMSAMFSDGQARAICP